VQVTVVTAVGASHSRWCRSQSSVQVTVVGAGRQSGMSVEVRDRGTQYSEAGGRRCNERRRSRQVRSTVDEVSRSTRYHGRRGITVARCRCMQRAVSVRSRCMQCEVSGRCEVRSTVQRSVGCGKCSCVVLWWVCEASAQWGRRGSTCSLGLRVHVPVFIRSACIRRSSLCASSDVPPTFLLPCDMLHAKGFCHPAISAICDLQYAICNVPLHYDAMCYATCFLQCASGLHRACLSLTQHTSLSPCKIYPLLHLCAFVPMGSECVPV